ncbi:unnamed protein product [Clavelina lepadiformis]|uniref:TIR domain-containing protein n=1 Tax=Clavelina lepadiformis TaxID=159417 RepID=A0ABP0FJP3_CLALP
MDQADDQITSNENLSVVGTNSPSSQPKASNDDKHVMISYNWESKNLAKKIYEKLENRGYKVWIDIKYMKKNIYDRMDEAVRNAYVVLIFVSRKYQESENCQREASMAADLKIPIVPIYTEEHFKPEKFLQCVTAGQLYHDFTNNKSFDSNFKELCSKSIDSLKPSRADIVIKKQSSNLVGGSIHPARAMSQFKIAEVNSTSSQPEANNDEKHVMISYNWESQKLAKKIYENLEKRGYKVWIDIKYMQKNIYDQMDEAVHNAYVVLILVSKKYQESENCRREASMAADLKIPIVPIYTEENFVPEMFLKLLTVGKLPHCFTNDKNFDSIFEELCSKSIDSHKRVRGDHKTETQNSNLEADPIQPARGKGQFKIAEVNSTSSQPHANNDEKHVMISYQWESRKLAKKIYENLEKRGYKVWIDIKYMQKNIYDQMDEAVRNAYVVLILVSKKYQESENCQREASMAADLKIPIVPIYTEENFEPAKFLKILTAGKLPHCFTNDKNFDSNFEELCSKSIDSRKS